jgi:hypothetical protein
MGEIIKLLMITSSGSEGINLKNTRFVHIMEPYWHPVRIEQVIGRARRICSHNDLPKNMQNVEVFIYLMEFTKEQIESDYSIELRLFDKSRINEKKIVTSDEALYEISQIKEEFVKQLTDVIKETSFDCSLYGNKKCLSFGDVDNSSFSYVPDYSKEQKNIGISKQQVSTEVKRIKLKGQEYCYTDISETKKNIYDLDSCIKSQEPELLFILEMQSDGSAKIIKV